MYDVTTLHFEVEHEDKLRKVGYSKERRVDPQIIVGLLVDRHGFPLEIGSWEGNKTETNTIIPIINQSHDPTPARRSGGGRRRRHAVDDQPPNTSRGGIGVHCRVPPGQSPG
jgi:putative transposase